MGLKKAQGKGHIIAGKIDAEGPLTAGSNSLTLLEWDILRGPSQGNQKKPEYPDGDTPIT